MAKASIPSDEINIILAGFLILVIGDHSKFQTAFAEISIRDYRGDFNTYIR